MATTSSDSVNKGKPGAEVGVYVANFLPGDCPPDVVDPRVLFCETDGGCEWAEICDDGDLVCINDVWYYTWRPKGIKDDFEPTPKDPGIHVHLSCNVDQTGIRLTGADIIEIFENLCDPDTIKRFCDWFFSNCLNSAEYMQWVCDTIVNFCFPQQEFIDSFCEWFILNIFNNQKFIDAFVQWLLTNIFTNPALINQLCDILETCLTTDAGVRDRVCEIVEECLQTNSDVQNEICNIVETCLTDTVTQDIICSIVKDYCVTTGIWNSNTDPDPTGTPASDWYLQDVVSGCVTHICIGGVWVCLGAPV